MDHLWVGTLVSRTHAALLAVSAEDVKIGDRTAERDGAAGTLTATYTLNLDGNQYANTDVTTNATSKKDYWVLPNADAANFECKATLTSGAISTGDTSGAWLALTSSRSWTLSSAVAGLFTGVLSISIRRAGVGSALATSAITLTVSHS